MVKESVDPAGVFHSDKSSYGNNDWNATYNFAGLFKLNETSNIKAVYGRAINFSAPSELMVSANPLKPADIQSAELIYTGLYFSKLSVSVSGFYNKINNLIAVSIGDNGVAGMANSGKKETKGSELMFTYKPGQAFELSGAVTYQKTKDKSYKEEIDAALSPDLLAVIKTSYIFNRNISVALTGQYVSEMEAAWADEI